MRTLAHAGGCNVLSTIHQPSSEAFHSFDRVILLSAGKAVFFGPLEVLSRQLAAADYRCPAEYNLADHALYLVQTLEAEKVADLTAKMVDPAFKAVRPQPQRQQHKPPRCAPPRSKPCRATRKPRAFCSATAQPRCYAAACLSRSAVAHACPPCRRVWPQAAAARSEGRRGSVQLAGGDGAGFLTQLGALSVREARDVMRNKVRPRRLACRLAPVALSSCERCLRDFLSFALTTAD
eukprot:2936992-Prymnesium_polylepis.1